MVRRPHRLVLDPEPGSVATGRRWAAHEAVLAHASDEAARTVELLTSEILTNAVVHTRAHRHIALTAECHHDCVRVEVTDPDPTLPLVRPGNARRIGGHGMRLVDALASAWGIDLHPGVGKTVWFEMPVAARGHALTA
ncbi:ATP-binding protein [Cellulomonas pakistanensis]|uniref:ATP-binding protein n=1 Tax=Cellulomonas pakistanensis TaxID=992287 RepID=A0A919P923_9CELL|nr:ATP-binding protein [Cellulomonas pakistanensis]GIG34669.1 ATP-binding protein [Cellulomonas pakistanensis]